MSALVKNREKTYIERASKLRTKIWALQKELSFKSWDDIQASNPSFRDCRTELRMVAHVNSFRIPLLRTKTHLEETTRELARLTRSHAKQLRKTEKSNEKFREDETRAFALYYTVLDDIRRIRTTLVSKKDE